MIEFVPTQDAVLSTFVGVLPSILHLMDELPRLYERFKLPAAGLRRFRTVIERDAEIKGIQDHITEGMIFYNKVSIYEDYINLNLKAKLYMYVISVLHQVLTARSRYTIFFRDKHNIILNLINWMSGIS